MIAALVLAATTASAAPAPAVCRAVDGLGCWYASPDAPAADATLMIYFRGWTKGYNGVVPSGLRASSSRAAFADYRLQSAADAAKAVVLVTGSSDAAVKDAEIAALEKETGRNFSKLILASHSGGYVGLTASVPPSKPVARVVMLDNFYFDDAPDSLAHKIGALVDKGAACAGFYTPHNKDRYQKRFAPHAKCAVDAFGPADHDEKVKACLTSYATGAACP